MADTLLQVYETAYRTDSAKRVRVYPDNLPAALSLHTGEHDAPSGLTTALPGYAVSPYDANLQAFLHQLDEGVALYEFVLVRPTLPFEPEDEDRPAYETVVFPPDGWLSVREVCADKDVNKSAVARAVEQRLVRVALCSLTRQRYVCPDAAYDAWRPRRQTDFLLKRRLLIVRSILGDARPRSTERLYQRACSDERRRFGSAHLSCGASVATFFERVLGPLCPRTVSQWVASIDRLLSLSDSPGSTP